MSSIQDSNPGSLDSKLMILSSMLQLILILNHSDNNADSLRTLKEVTKSPASGIQRTWLHSSPLQVSLSYALSKL